MTAPVAQGNVRYFDKDGKPTPEGLAYLRQLQAALNDALARIAALEAL